MTSKSTASLFRHGTTFLLLSLAVACGSSKPGDSTGVGTMAPLVTATTPTPGATGIAINTSASATFSEAMDPATLTPTTFTLTSGVALLPVLGTVTYAHSKAMFWPTAHLTVGGLFTATITTGAKSAAGIALAAKKTWTFTAGDSVGTGLPVDLGTASTFVILAKTGIAVVPIAVVTGNLGVSPAAATYITEFSLMADSTNVFSTSAQVTGKVYASNYAPPTPSNLTTAVSDMELAFTDAAARAPDVTELVIGSAALATGVYKWTSGLSITTDLTLTGSATDVWIFQIAQGLTMASATNVTLTGGAMAKNVFWQVGGLVDIGTTAHLEGTVLTQTAVTMDTGASIKGRLLAQTAVTLGAGSVVTAP